MGPRAGRRLDDYRGINANMHTVEAYLAVGDVTGDPRWHARAGRIAERVVGFARENHWRIPEHFDAAWTPLPDYNLDVPAHPFRPYGATVGHGLEWARLLVAVAATLGDAAPGGWSTRRWRSTDACHVGRVGGRRSRRVRLHDGLGGPAGGPQQDALGADGGREHR